MPELPLPAKPRVLVADDDAVIRGLVRLELELGCFDVLEAENGLDALVVARNSQLDVILLDVQMPGLDGHVVLAKLKADSSTRDFPVVFLTGGGTADDAVAALRAGAHDYLSKPPDRRDLLARVGGAYRVKQLQDELRERAAQLETLSRTDYLTGLHNRRHAQQHLDSVLAAARRHQFPLAVLLLDIDNFKSVNDRRGHAAGDEVLCEVARVLRGTVRAEDVLARWGGEEFLVIAGHTDDRAAEKLAERLRREVSEACEVTLSIGGATSGGDGDLVGAADRNLYAAKAAGRNRCVVTALVRTHP